MSILYRLACIPRRSNRSLDIPRWEQWSRTVSVRYAVQTSPPPNVIFVASICHASRTSVLNSVWSSWPYGALLDTSIKAFTAKLKRGKPRRPTPSTETCGVICGRFVNICWCTKEPSGSVFSIKSFKSDDQCDDACESSTMFVFFGGSVATTSNGADIISFLSTLSLTSTDRRFWVGWKRHPCCSINII